MEKSFLTVIIFSNKRFLLCNIWLSHKVKKLLKNNSQGANII